MIHITYKENKITVQNKDELLKKLEEIVYSADKSDTFCMIEDLDFTLEIWLIHQKRECVLLYIPKDERDDCLISCCGDREKIDNPVINIGIGNHTIMCSDYSILSIRSALKNIKDLYSGVEIYKNENWFSY